MVEDSKREFAEATAADQLLADEIAQVAATPAGFVRPSDSAASGIADGARRALGRALRQLDGSKDLVVALAENRAPPLVLRALDDRLTRADRVALEGLRQGLDRLAGRQRPARRDV